MFDLVTETWNPITGCNHECVYCWARRLATTRLKRLERYKHGFVPRLNASELGRKFKPGTLVFAVDMGDIFSPGVEDGWVLRVLKRMAEFPETTFLLLTKNPARYFDFLDKMPGNAVLGATVETDDDDLYRRAKISKAPPPSERLKTMKALPWGRKFISVEPVLSFTPRFADEIAEARPLLVYVGYDNYGHELPEPTLDEVLSLIRGLRSRGIEVRVKTLRPAWHEDTRICAGLPIPPSSSEIKREKAINP
jgi:DNA repair photolyase